MPDCLFSRRLMVNAVAASLLVASGALAQQSGLALPSGGMHTPVRVVQAPPDPSSPEFQAAREFNKQKRAAERELRRIRLKHFGDIRKTEIRQAGIIKVRQFTEPAAMAAMIEILGPEAADVRTAVLDHLATQQSPEADAALAWAAVFDKNRAFRAEAADRVARRSRQNGAVPLPAQQVIATGLGSGNTAAATAAGQLAGTLRLLEAIPMMIAAQAGPQGSQYYGGQPDNPDESLAYIIVGTQRTFVADLTPVVGENAVAFDPQIGVITEGVVLRVINAFVFQYNMDLHTALVDMTSAEWGQPTAGLGWDQQKWMDWHDNEFKPHVARKAAAESENKAGPRTIPPQ